MKLPSELIARVAPAYAGVRVCVTGGAGFIGGHLVDALLSLRPADGPDGRDRSVHITVIDDLSNSTIDHLAELIELEPDRLRFIHSSILDPIALNDAMHGCHTVFHLAAMGSVPASIAEPARSFAVNATGTVRVLEAARAAGVKRFVNSSSSSVYGDSEADARNGAPIPKVETQLPRPLSPYAASKLSAEAAVRAWSQTFGIGALSLRYFNVFGPRQNADSQYAAVIPAFVKRVLSGQAPVIYGDGSQSRDFTPVASVVAANLLAGSAPGSLRGQPLNIGTGQRITIADLARQVCDALGMPHVQPQVQPARAGDIKHSLADIAAARALIGYQPVGQFAEALLTTVNWYRQALADSESAS